MGRFVVLGLRFVGELAAATDDFFGACDDIGDLETHAGPGAFAFAAVVDADDKVVGNDRIVYQAGIQADSALKYPVIDYRVTVKPDQRLVISLLPAP